MRSQNLLTEILKFYSLFLNLVTKVLLKIREGISCGGISLKLSLTDDDQDPCYIDTKYNFNTGDRLEWNFEDSGNCSSANLNLKSTKVLDLTNPCLDYLTIRTDNDNLLVTSLEKSFQSFTGNRSFIFNSPIDKYMINIRAITLVEFQVRELSQIMFVFKERHVSLLHCK